ncbi:glycoside hydrolase family protein [Roseibium algae]|uniref:Lysozyme n=1 Tax=Roseibium algae TaxID=3123038 RepID=A0ABU8TIH2_9HYPH
MRVSEKGLAFLASHEGFVSRAYLDPAGIVTIGYGFTMRSGIFAGWWRTRFGRSLKLGDTLSREEANRLLVTLLDEEYGPPVEQALPDLDQARFDACVSVVYNLGPRALTWKWAKALKGGDVALSAKLLAKTGTTAGGRRLPGLVRRRQDEANVIMSGEFGPLSDLRSSAKPDPALKQAQTKLADLGYQSGPADGLDGPVTRKAVLEFQRDHPPLAIDGRIGPATRATLQRITERGAGRSTAAGVGLVSATVAGTAGLNWSMVFWVGLGLAFGVFAVSWLWRYRGRWPVLWRARWHLWLMREFSSRVGALLALMGWRSGSGSR